MMSAIFPNLTRIKDRQHVKCLRQDHRRWVCPLMQIQAMKWFFPNSRCNPEKSGIFLTPLKAMKNEWLCIFVFGVRICSVPPRTALDCTGMCSITLHCIELNYTVLCCT